MPSVNESAELRCLIDQIELVVNDEQALLELRAAARSARGLSTIDRTSIDARIGTYLADIARENGRSSRPSAP
jgi:hypothetical protein